ncbi:MAG: uroporphyrinogen-III synthase [Planctomycetales bacterium]|nr:uroporphyrinogen-III synthase [Planctomycetales bacterium]
MSPRPLEGLRVVLTRPRERSAAMTRALAAAGAEVLAFPTVAEGPPEDPGPLAEAARGAAGFAWIVFTSVAAVQAFCEAAAAAGAPLAAEGPPRIAAVGPATAGAAELRGLRVAARAREATGRALAEALAAGGGLRGARVLFPKADRARPDLPDALRLAGAEVVEVVAYRTLPGAGDPEVAAAIRAGRTDVVVFASPSAVEGYVELLGPSVAAAGPPAVAIGPTTGAAVRASGLALAATAAAPTPGAIVAALAAWRARG